ncbi:hypothetical protein BDR04DRAFT_1129041 [Suillus decipiens]|nr:hypothetical protein BDR04DRAFT_1129041 [Suillus decipiens]
MAVQHPKPRRHKVSTLEAESAMQEELPPNTIKKTNQWCRWSEEVIPSLIVPYLAYMQETSILHYANIVRQPHRDTVACHAGCGTCSIKVACVFFDSLSEINIIVCPCFPAPLQLLHHGLFPCAPVAPSLAVDLHVLEFVCLLFICQSPNHTAWCNAVETFLDGMGYKLTSMHSLHCRFSNAFHWYQVLTILACDHISNLIADTWKDKIHLQPMAVEQPTEYLYSHCPLCFGENDWQKANNSRFMPDIIVCIDACFTQKHSTNPRGADGHDPPNPTPSFFLPKDDVHQERVSRMEPEEDRYEMGMSLMALLCRHDRVLWIVNLISAGERQHYSLALLDCLFKHLIPQMTVRLLYDIGCQLEWSCRKWSLLDETILSQITFAVAIFYAYGHQWPCQIIYHPRKHEGFGLSDGEGLLQGFGHWLHWHWIHCQKKKNAALDNLQDLDLNKDMLRIEWKAQIAHQTRPAPCQSMNKAAKVITTLLALEKTLDAHNASVHKLEAQLYGVTNTIRHCRSALGVEDKAELEKMKKDIYLTARLNAHAVKTHIQDRLCQQKFELERLERSYRASINAEKLHTNMQHSIKRHKPGILKLVLTYNGLCSHICSLIQQWQVPPFAIPPHSILCDGIFQLNIDNNIWQDIGLDDTTVNPPAWLSDEAVRNSIWLQLEVDHCFKEEA